MFGRWVTRRLVTVMLAAAGLLVAPVLAGDGDQDQDCPPCDPHQILKTLEPANIDAIIVVNSAARQRSSVGGRALEMMLQDANMLPVTRSAWRELATALDWSGERAFDELLGQRVAIVMRGLDDPARTQWAVLSEVSGATERRLRERLRPALRGRTSGFPSFSVEDGRYELIVGPAGIGADGRLRGDGAMILLGPGGDNRLLAQLAPMLLRPIAPLRDAAGRECDVVLLLRRPHTAEGEGGDVLLTGTHEASGWGLRLHASPGMVWGRPEGVERLTPWTDGAFRALEKNALVAMMGVIGSTRLEGIASVPALANMIPVIPLTLEGDAFGHRAAFYIRQEPEIVMKQLPQTPLRAAAVGPAASDGGRLSIGMAIEARDSQKMLFEGDQLIARLIGGLESGRFEQRIGQHVQLVVAIPDDRVRVLPLEGKPIYYMWARGIERAFGREPIVSWVVRTTRGSLQNGSGPIPGWWLAALSPADSSTVERDAAALAAGGTGVALPRLSIGVIRPAALEEAVARLDPDFLAPLRGMKWVDSVRWDAWQRDDGAVEATIRIRMQSRTQ